MKRQHWVIIGLLVVGWMVFFGQSTAVSTELRMIFAQLATPFVKLGDAIPSVRSRRQLARENQQLRAENESLRQQVRALGALGDENLRLRQQLNVKALVSSRTLGARVIGRDASSWWKSIQIDRGTQDGIRENMAVINADGVVGKTISATRDQARVLLLIDPGCRASAQLRDSLNPGIVSGLDRAFQRDPRLVMTFIDRSAKIGANEPVITSGQGGLFPPNIPIGTVVRVRLNPQTGMYQDAEIKPAVDFLRLEEVAVVVE